MPTHEQAVQTVEQMIQDLVGHMHPTPRLEVLGGTNPPCSGPNDDRVTNQVMYESSYWLRDVDPSYHDEMFRQVRQYWSERRYAIVLELGRDHEFRKVVAQHPTSGFQMSLAEGQSVLSIRAQSVCVPRPSRSAGVGPSR